VGSTCTDAVSCLLASLRSRAPAAHPAEFYPLSTSAIVICVMLCDLIGISKGMRGVISEEQLEQLLTKSPRLAISVLLTKDGPHVGFQELFSFALAHFHVEFLRRDITYMESPELAREVSGSPTVPPPIAHTFPVQIRCTLHKITTYVSLRTASGGAGA
jgi:hypothetical protein